MWASLLSACSTSSAFYVASGEKDDRWTGETNGRFTGREAGDQQEEESAVLNGAEQKITPWRPIMKEMGYEREASRILQARRGVRDCSPR